MKLKYFFFVKKSGLTIKIKTCKKYCVIIYYKMKFYKFFKQ